MDTSKLAPTATFEQAVLKAKVAQICDHVGFHAITQNSANILVDIYQRLIYHLGRHCKDAANNNRRVESNLTDLIQAYDFVGISIPSLQEHIEKVKLPLVIDIQQDEQRPSNRIQRNLLVDDLLESEKNNHPEDGEDGDNKAVSESGLDEEEKPPVPLLKDTYGEIAKKFTNCAPVSADKKIRLGGRILFVANTKLKISPPIPPEPVPSTSGLDSGKPGKRKKRKEAEGKKKLKTAEKAPKISPLKQTRGRRKKKISREFVAPEPTPEKETESATVKDDEIEEHMEEKNLSESVQHEADMFEQERRLDEEEGQEEEMRLEEVLEEDEILGKEEDKQKVKLKSKGRGKGKDKSKEKDKNRIKSKEKDKKDKLKEKDKGRGKKTPGKKPKVIITPLDPSIAEPPSFFPILDTKVEEPDAMDSALDVFEPGPSETPVSLIKPPPAATIKQPKSKKRKKSSNQFAIVTETVSVQEEKEWLCPACNKPDDGDLMVQCDSCQEWYHLACTSLRKPPEDDENWECDGCGNKKRSQIRAQTPIEVIKMKTPDRVVVTPPPQSVVNVQVPEVGPSTTAVAPSGSSQDDLCPECNLPDDGTLMIQCDDPFCAKWFHGKCVNLLEDPEEDESWFCKVCVDKQQSAFKRRRRAK